MKDHTEHPWIGIFVGPLLFMVGVEFAFWPQRQQQRDVRRHEQYPISGILFSQSSAKHLEYLHSRRYLFTRRFQGVVMMVLGSILFALSTSRIIQ